MDVEEDSATVPLVVTHTFDGGQSEEPLVDLVTVHFGGSVPQPDGLKTLYYGELKKRKQMD